MLIALDLIVRGWTHRIAECRKELQQYCNRIGLTVGRDGVYDLASKAVIRGTCMTGQTGSANCEFCSTDAGAGC